MVHPTFLHELREAARTCSNREYATLVRKCADDLGRRLNDLDVLPTREHMMALNGAWAKAEAVLKALPPEADPSAPSSAGDAGMVPMRMAA